MSDATTTRPDPEAVQSETGEFRGELRPEADELLGEYGVPVPLNEFDKLRSSIFKATEELYHFHRTLEKVRDVLRELDPTAR